jgi:cystathionine beta-lyase/cystathionine gamma-synthase
VEFRFVQDPADPAGWDAMIDTKTRLVWVETPSNPCLFVTDIRAVADAAHARGVPLLVDNTTATAALQRPMDLGADMVLLSLSKFMSGNAAILGGALVGPEALIEDIRWNTTEFIGAIMPPMEAWMTLHHLETLSMRMQRHSANALAVARYLDAHPRVVQVNYSGLEDHPQHALACRQMSAHGGLLSFVAPGGMQGAAAVMNAFKLAVHAVTFGTSRSICMHPPTITHEHMTPAERRAIGIDDGLIRFSVGLENPEDIIADLEQALERA